MMLSMKWCCKILLNVFLILIFFNQLTAQQVVLQINSIEEAEKHFVVKGTVILSNLNPPGQIVEEDSCSIVADIKQGPGAEYQILPDSMSIRRPPQAETSFRKGKKYLTKKEFNGVKISSLVIFQTAPRGFNIWRTHGGLYVWRRNAPNNVTTEFEGFIPKHFAGKTLRIRASLRHQFGGPWVPWSGYTFFHDIGHEGVLAKGNIEKPDSHKIYFAGGPSGAPNPAGNGEAVQCTALGKDTQGHSVTYSWSVKPQAGSFDNPSAPNPIWTPPVNTMNKTRKYTISCTIGCSLDPSLNETGSFPQEVCPDIKPVSLKLKFTSRGFKPIVITGKEFYPKYQKLNMSGSILPMYRNSQEAGSIGSDSRVLVELIVLSGGKEVRAKRASVKMYSTYWLTVDLNEFAGCVKKEKASRIRNVRMIPLGDAGTDPGKGKNTPGAEELYNKILSGKYGEKKGFKKIWQMMGLYKAYQNDKVHILTGGKGTPNLNKFFKNLKQGKVGEIKNAVNTLWEYTKEPLTLGGSAIEDMIQNTNNAWKNIFGKGFLKKGKKGPNSISEAGAAIREKLAQLQKVMEAKK